jgi:hypothetical protein
MSDWPSTFHAAPYSHCYLCPRCCYYIYINNSKTWILIENRMISVKNVWCPMAIWRKFCFHFHISVGSCFHFLKIGFFLLESNSELLILLHEFEILNSAGGLVGRIRSGVLWQFGALYVCTNLLISSSSANSFSAPLFRKGKGGVLNLVDANWKLELNGSEVH